MSDKFFGAGVSDMQVSGAGTGGVQSRTPRAPVAVTGKTSVGGLTAAGLGGLLESGGRVLDMYYQADIKDQANIDLAESTEIAGDIERFVSEIDPTGSFGVTKEQAKKIEPNTRQSLILRSRANQAKTRFVGYDSEINAAYRQTTGKTSGLSGISVQQVLFDQQQQDQENLLTAASETGVPTYMTDDGAIDYERIRKGVSFIQNADMSDVAVASTFYKTQYDGEINRLTTELARARQSKNLSRVQELEGEIADFKIRLQSTGTLGGNPVVNKRNRENYIDPRIALLDNAVEGAKSFLDDNEEQTKYYDDAVKLSQVKTILELTEIDPLYAFVQDPVMGEVIMTKLTPQLNEYLRLSQEGNQEEIKAVAQRMRDRLSKLKQNLTGDSPIVEPLGEPVESVGSVSILKPPPNGASQESIKIIGGEIRDTAKNAMATGGFSEENAPAHVRALTNPNLSAWVELVDEVNRPTIQREISKAVTIGADQISRETSQRLGMEVQVMPNGEVYVGDRTFSEWEELARIGSRDPSMGLGAGARQGQDPIALKQTVGRVLRERTRINQIIALKRSPFYMAQQGDVTGAALPAGQEMTSRERMDQMYTAPENRASFTDQVSKALEELGILNPSVRPKVEGVIGENRVVEDKAEVWGALYQSESDPAKMANFIQDAESVEIQPGVVSGIDTALTAVEGDKGVTDTSNLRELLILTAKHESKGGQYLEQIGGGPARGAFQVEPATAKDILETSGLFGPKAARIVGKSKEELLGMTDEQIGEILKRHEVGALFAAMKYLQAADAKGMLDRIK